MPETKTAGATSSTASHSLSATGLHVPARSNSLLKKMLRFVRRQPLGAASLAIILILVFAAVFANIIAPFDPIRQSYRSGEIKAPPSATHLFGTDQYGRDVFSRIIYGARISLWVGFVAVVAGVLTGSVVGLAGGYLGGRIDLALQVFTDIFLAFPALILAMALVSVLGFSATSITLAVSLVLLPTTARVVRSATIAIRSNQYVESSRAIGCRASRIILRHILPNIFPTILIQASVSFGGAILAEGALSFLGLGTQPPEPTWGNMLNEGRGEFEVAPWLAFFPGLAISLAVLAFNLFGDAVRDLLDPTQKR